MNTHHFKHILFFMFAGLAACAQNTDLDKEVKKLYKNTVPVARNAQVSTNVIVLDTREKAEFDVSHLPRARWVGYDDFDLKRVANISKKDTIIVYCSIGYRSERVGEKLKKAGYTNVYNLYGGIFNWKNTNGVVVNSTNDTTEKVHCYSKSWGRFLTKGQKVY